MSIHIHLMCAFSDSIANDIVAPALQLTHGIRLYPNRAPATAANPSAYMNTTVPGEFIAFHLQFIFIDANMHR